MNNHIIEKSPSLAEIRLKYASKWPKQEFPKITTSKEAVNVLHQVWDEDTIELKEEFIILLLNNAKKCLGWSKISSGGVISTIMDPATIF